MCYRGDLSSGNLPPPRCRLFRGQNALAGWKRHDPSRVRNTQLTSSLRNLIWCFCVEGVSCCVTAVISAVAIYPRREADCFGQPFQGASRQRPRKDRLWCGETERFCRMLGFVWGLIGQDVCESATQPNLQNYETWAVGRGEMWVRHTQLNKRPPRGFLGGRLFLCVKGFRRLVLLWGSGLLRA